MLVALTVDAGPAAAAAPSVALPALDDASSLSITLTSRSNPALRGDPVPFEITVSPATTSGWLHLVVGSAGKQVELNPSGTMVATWSFLQAGVFDVTAQYWDVSGVQASSNVVQQTVTAFATTASLEVEPAAFYGDEQVTATITITPPPDAGASASLQTHYPWGWRTSAGPFPLDPATGTATISFEGARIPGFTHGSFFVRAAFGGNDHYDQSYGEAVELTGRRDASAVTVETTSVYEWGIDPIVATAKVAPAPAADGVVEFRLLQGDREIRSVWADTDAQGAAPFHVSPTLAAGTYEIVAYFRGTTRLWPSEGRTTFSVVDTTPPLVAWNVNGGVVATTSRDVNIEVSVANGTGSAVTVAALSHDGISWTMLPYAPTIPWTLTEGDGLKSVWGRFQDASGNWSRTARWDLTLMAGATRGSVLVAGGARFVTDPLTTVTVHPEDGGLPVTHVALSNDATTWTTQAVAPSYQWLLSPANGGALVWAKLRNTAGNWSVPVYDFVVLDPDAPEVSAVTHRFAAGASVSSGRLPVTLTWTGWDVTSGVARYELQQSTDGGAYVPLSTTIIRPWFTRTLAPGSTYRFRVRAIDRAGNVSGWSYGTTFAVSAVPQTSSRITYSGAWYDAASTSFLGGSAKYASAAGAKARISVTGRSFAWIASVGPTRGSANVYVDGVLVKTVSLYAASGAHQRVVYSQTWDANATRSIEIRVIGTLGRPRVDIDGIAWGS